VTISPGTRLGPYEVVALLGAGGMGEVYRARDTRLDRTVALKVLPQRVSATTMARERFEREARAISALNHPNICTLFDVGSHDGTEYLVMELIEGEPLKGPLPVEDVLRIGEAIASALARAHRAGIVHRDLKPGNIMLTKSGPKLLDFGLARRADEQAPKHDATTVIGKAITTDGMILGTLPYMAPEQLEGKPADARTDIFALGAVLYEMITGRRAFNAESQASLITMIMSAQPPPIATLQPIAPPTLNRTVMKCLEKDPDDRWQSASDVATELRWIGEGTATANATAKRTRAWLPWLLASLFAILAGLAFALRKPSGEMRTVRFDVDPPPNGRFRTSPTDGSLAVSPDGKRIAFIASDTERRVWLHDVASGVSKVIEGSEHATTPFWSPDGRMLGFAALNKLKTVLIDDNRVQNVCDLKGSGLEATWLADGTIIFTEFLGGGVFAVAGAGGTPRKLFGIPKGSFEVVAPAAIGATHSFFFNTLEEKNNTALWIGDANGGTPHKLIDDTGRAFYDPPYVTFVRDATLFAQRFDEGKLALSGRPVSLADNVWFFKPLGQSLHAAAGDTIAYNVASYVRTLRWINRAGQDLGEAMPPGRYRARVRVSRDSRHLVTPIEDAHSLIADIWTADLQRQALTRMTFGDHDYDDPIWSPDGRTIAFSSDPKAAPYVFTMQAGGGAQRAVTKPGNVQVPSDWLKDGRILYSDEGADGGDIFLVRPGEPPQEWLKTPAAEGDARISPDQRWVVYSSRDVDLSQIYVAPFDHHAPPVRVSTNGGLQATWSADGTEIYFQHQNELWAAKVTVTGDTIDTAAPVRFYTADKPIESYDVAGDGRILVDLAVVSPIFLPMRVIVGWKEEAARLLGRP